MSRFFSTDSPIFSGINAIIDIAWVSILWLIFSIPVFTVGASTTALYYTVTKVIRHHRGYIWREFFSSFKANFKQSTVIWLIYVLVIAIFWVDMRVMSAFGTTVAKTMKYSFIIGMIMVTAVLFYALAYTARFVQTVKGIIFNSALMALRHFPQTILIMIIAGLAVLSIYLMGIAFILAPAIAAVLDSILLEKIFVRYMSEEDRKKEEIRNHPEQYEYMHPDE